MRCTLTPNGLFDDTWTARRTPCVNAAAHHVLRAAGVDLDEVVHPRRVDHAGRVDQVDDAVEVGEQLAQPVGVAHVADDGVDAGEGARERSAALVRAVRDRARADGGRGRAKRPVPAARQVVEQLGHVTGAPSRQPVPGRSRCTSIEDRVMGVPSLEDALSA